MADYGFVHADRVYTPNGTPDVPATENDDRNKAIEVQELAAWQQQPDRMLAYYRFDNEDRYPRTGKVSTWLGTQLGTIISSRFYRHNFGGRFVSLRVRGTNGAEYYGRASYDWGTCVTLRKAKR